MDEKDKKREEAFAALSRLVGFDVTDDNARPGDDLSWHPALSDSQKADIRAGRARAYIYQGVLVFEHVGA